jgi:hypothetical protein
MWLQGCVAALQLLIISVTIQAMKNLIMLIWMVATNIQELLSVTSHDGDRLQL